MDVFGEDKQPFKRPKVAERADVVLLLKNGMIINDQEQLLDDQIRTGFREAVRTLVFPNDEKAGIVDRVADRAGLYNCEKK